MQQHRKALLAVVIVGLLAGAIRLGLLTAGIVHRRAEASKKVSVLPNIALQRLDSTWTSSLAWAQQQQTIIFYFDPNCDHCQNEAKELQSRAADFTQIRLLWISTAALPALRQFEANYGLQQRLPSLMIGQVRETIAHTTLGLHIVPSILVYSADGVLQEKFVGQTKVDLLLISFKGK